jgi:hypothetical protein
MGRARPLAARRWLLRNPRRVAPAIAVQALVTALVLSVVTPLSGFEETWEPVMKPLRAFTPVTPAERAGFDEDLARVLDGNPAQESRVEAKAFWIRTPMVVGDGGASLLALDSAVQEDFLRRIGDRLVEGTLPAKDGDGVALHKDIARARDLRIGSSLGQRVDPDETLPGEFHVVGLLDGPSRVGLADLAFASRTESVLSRLASAQVVYAKPGRKAESDAYLEAAKGPDGRAALKVWSESFWRRRTEKALKNLPIVLDAVVGSITVIIALVVVLLAWISFQSRSDEFALLLAVGRTRRRLVGKVAAETLVASGVAWALGLGLGFAFLATWSRLVLEPKAIVMRFVDPYPVALASTLPVVAALASVVVLAWRLHRMDPVAVIQRRNA